MALSRHNNFDILRLLFASMVVLYHCHDLSRNAAYSWIPFIASSRLAVEGFFTMSGCLIVGSYDQNPRLGQYFEKRARRLLPAYWCALIFSLILGLFESSLHFGTFLRSLETWKYIFANLSFLNFLHPTLPGVFLDNPVMPAVNGALWTIKVEVMFYLLVPAIVFCCRKLGVWQALATIFISSVLFRIVASHSNYPALTTQLPGQLCFFAIGALVYFYYPQFMNRRLWMWVLALVSYVISLGTGWIFFRALGVGLGVVCAGLLMPYYRGITKYGDFSYGIYVFHFPIIQTFIALGVVGHHPFIALILICISVGGVATFSWNVVEKPFLKRKKEREQPAYPRRSSERP